MSNSTGGPRNIPAALEAAEHKFEAKAPGDRFYRQARSRGFYLQGLFESLSVLWVNENGTDWFSEVQIPGDVADLERYVLHPAIYDSSWQPLGSFTPDGMVGLPVSVQSIRVFCARDTVPRYSTRKQELISLYNASGESSPRLKASRPVCLRGCR